MVDANPIPTGDAPVLANLAEVLQHIPALSAEEAAAITLAAGNDLLTMTRTVADLAREHAENFLALTAVNAEGCVTAMTDAVIVRDAAIQKETA